MSLEAMQDAMGSVSVLVFQGPVKSSFLSKNKATATATGCNLTSNSCNCNWTDLNQSSSVQLPSCNWSRPVLERTSCVPIKYDIKAVATSLYKFLNK